MARPAVYAEDAVAVREPAVGKRVLGIERDGLLEVRDRQPHRRRRALVPEMASAAAMILLLE